MDKKEFLDVLRQFLAGEVSPDVIEQNIRYYDQYISSKTLEEEARIIEMLGDPRLIARTIIETEKAANQKGKYQRDYHNSYSEYDKSEEGTGPRQEKQNRNIFYTNLNWKQKLTAIFILIAVIVVLVFVGRLIVSFLFTFGIPILLIVLLFRMFRRHN